MISVNVLTWNNESTIIGTLSNILADIGDCDYEFIIVDNGSDDSTCSLIDNWLNSFVDGHFSFIRNKDNLGISIAKNQAISLSEGEYIFMVDGDVIPVPNTIKLMIQWLDENPDKHAIGMLPNKFVTSPDMAEEVCNELVCFKEHKCCCLYYGMYRRSMFDNGLRMSEEGEFGRAGYGWEDHDFFKRMTNAGYKQYTAEINKPGGRYLHLINSSIRAMGRDKYIETSRIRGKQFKEIWADAT